MVVSLRTLGGAAGYVEAVVDTGAEITTLMPPGVRALNIRHTDVQALSGPVMNMVGVGGSASFKLTPAQVYLVDSSGQGVTSPFALEIALAASPRLPMTEPLLPWLS